MLVVLIDTSPIENHASQFPKSGAPILKGSSFDGEIYVMSEATKEFLKAVAGSFRMVVGVVPFRPGLSDQKGSA